MPHFVIDCSESILSEHSQEYINQEIHQVAANSGLFTESDIKVRVNPYKTYLVGNKDDAFIHLFVHIMQGRNTEQKAELSKSLVKKLVELFPDIDNIAANIAEFEKATYCKKSML